MKKAMTTSARRRAVTLVELLVVLAILSLLATLAVPVYVNKTEQARRTTARSEVRAIATAQDQVLLTHGYYVPIHTLDNVYGVTTTAQIRDDFGNDTVAGQKFLIDPFINLADQEGNQVSIQDALNNTNAKAATLVDNWAGPFLNPVRVASNGDENDQQNRTNDIVLDPWGRPYIFFSPIGIIAAQSSITDLNGFDKNAVSGRLGFDNGEIQSANSSAYPFDRYAIVSYGSDGQFDYETGTGDLVDDLLYEFGFAYNETAFNAF